MAATPGRGRLPQRPDRADPVRAADRDGARGAAAVLPAVDQQVLHHGSGAREEPDRVGGPARPHLLRDQLPQPRRVDARPRTSTTTCGRARSTPSASSGRSPARPRSTPSPSASAGRSTAIALALQRRDRRPTRSSRPRSSTPTPTSARPGTLGVFTDEATIAGLEKQMAKKGYLDSNKMAHTFDALRANDLVFQYVVNNWLMGKKPPAFDLLAWNKDSTRMPARMHSRVPAVVLPQQRVRPRRVRDRRPEARPRQGRRRHIRAVGRRRSHRPVGLGLQDHPAARRQQPVRAQHLRPHRRHRQPARTRSPSTGPTTPYPVDPQEWKDDAAARGRHLVGGLGHWIAQRRAALRWPPHAAGKRGPSGARGRSRQLRAHPRMNVRGPRAGDSRMVACRWAQRPCPRAG